MSYAMIRNLWARSIALLTANNSGFASTIQTMIRSILLLGINFCTGVLTARYLGAEGRGEQAAMIVWPQLLGWACMLGLPQAVIYQVRSDPDRAPRLVTAACLLGILTGIVAAVLGVILLPHWLVKYSEPTVAFAQWAMLMAPFVIISGIFVASMQAVDRFLLFNGLALIGPIVTIVGLVILIAAGHFTPQLSALVYLFPHVAIFICGLIVVICIYKPRRDFGRTDIQKLLCYGVRVWSTDILALLSDQIERAILVGILQPAVLGLYVVAQSVAGLLGVINASTLMVLFPKAVGKGLDDVLKLVGLTVRTGFAVNVAGAIVLGLAARPILRIFYGSDFAEAILAVRILLCVQILNAIYFPSLQAFMAVGRPGVVTVAQGLALALFVPLVLYLAPRFGFNGAAMAWLSSVAIRTVAICCCFPIVLYRPPPKLLLRTADVAEIVATIRFAVAGR